jgi:CSLREA domain-containing protein
VLVDGMLGRRRGWALAIAVAALACALVAAPAARAEQFTVNSTGDEVDDSLGDESCHTTGGVCTLRAAIETVNGLEEFDEIFFDEKVFDGGQTVPSTIGLGSELPPITERAAINGRECPTAAGVSGPCVGIDSQSGDPALVVSGIGEGEISGLAITGAQTAVSLEGSIGIKIRGSWFGVALDGASVGNGTGVLIGPGSDESFIGGEGPGQGNVFAGNAADGLDVHGGNGVMVYGNYFGVEPDGVTPNPNGGDDIEVVSTGGLEVTGTEIGTRVSSTATTSPGCDGGCNVIAGAVLNGVDLEGEGEESPATSTSVLSNYIGVNATGTAAVPNAAAGVNVGEAAHTLVGGPSAGETNRINGGSVGVLAGPAAGDLAVRGNLIGTDAAGTGTLDPPDDGIVVDSADLASPTLEAEIAANEIRMEGGVAILQRGQGAWIHGNEISGSQTGIRTFVPTEYGNVVQGNLIEGSKASGILVENNFNEIVGNEVLGTGGAGIWIQGNNPEAIRNSVGGDAGGDENVIDGSAGPAIEISNVEETNNEVARNRGTGNGGLFIDLVATSPATEVGPNRGIKPPTFSTTTQTGASGGAKEGATVRVFRKQTSAAGELESFLGEAIADKNNSWTVTYDGEIPTGTIVAATQTKDGATSELTVASSGSEGSLGGGAGGALVSGGAQGMFASAAAPTRPRTKIVAGRSRHHAARFVFAADQIGSTFLCRLDDKPFDICRSPKRYMGLGAGKHVFWVRAIGPAGHVDLSPAKKKFSTR